jgi:hypothetical protein
VTSAAMRTFWRTLVNEFDTVVVSDTLIDTYIQRALEALNRRVQYHVSDNTVTIVAGTQEYALPSDVVKVLWAEWNGTFLNESDQDQWRSVGVSWRSAAAANPTDFTIYARKIVFYPKPSSAAVITSPTVNIRYVSAPGDFTANGPEQLSDQDHALVVEYAAMLWSAARADGPVSSARVQSLNGIFEGEAKAMQGQYAAREMMR